MEGKQPFEAVVTTHGATVLRVCRAVLGPADARDPHLDLDADLTAALTNLPAKQKQAVAYHYLAGLAYADVAAILGGSPDAARRAAADGIATLRRSYLGVTATKGEPE